MRFELFQLSLTLSIATSRSQLVLSVAYTLTQEAINEMQSLKILASFLSHNLLQLLSKISS